MDTLETLLSFHRVERKVYRRMIDVGIITEVARRVMAFWMWLASKGYPDFLKKISSHDDRFLALASVEAEAVLASFQSDNEALPSSHLHNIPITSNLTDYGFSLKDFHLNLESNSREISHILDGVCSIIFEDILKEKEDINAGGGGGGGVDSAEGSATVGGGGRANAITKWVRPFGEGTSQQGGAIQDGAGLLGPGFIPYRPGGLGLPPQQMGFGVGVGFVGEGARPVIRSTLNPLATPWSPLLEPEDERCLFLTFSNGHPLTENEIADFFNRMYGPWVEKVYVNQPEPGKGPPLFGKVVFHSSMVVGMVMNGREKAKFTVRGKPLRCRKYRPKHQRGRGD